MRSRIHSRWPILGVHGWMWLWMLFLGATAPAQVIISEFVADNVLGLRDEDGQSEDWIEVHNISPAPVDLAGWHLTDSASDLRQWTFPEISIGPGEFMVVHASGKDRRRPDAPLHTTFRLSASGEYLALVRPDGSIASAFSPAYPPQAPDVSFGLSASSVTVPLLSSLWEGRVWVPTDASVENQWFDPEFDDNAWKPVVGGVGWDATGATPSLSTWIGTDIADFVQGRNATVYLRVPFVVTNVTELDQLELRLRFDDGFVAYLNGHEIARRLAPVASPGGIVASQAEDWSASGQQGMNSWYYGVYDAAADADGVYDHVGDFNTVAPGWTWEGSQWSLGPGNPPWTFISRESWHPDGNSGGVNVRWAIRRWVSQTAGNVVVILSGAKENPGCGNGVTYRLMVNGEEHFARTIRHADVTGFETSIEIEDLDFGDHLDFILDPTGVDGDTGDGCDGSSFSAQIIQAPSEGLHWNSTALRDRTATEAAEVTSIDITANRNRLVAGTNVLAFQVLNATPDDADLLLAAELHARYSRIDPDTARYFATPTPGAANTEGLKTLGPVITRVEHSPNVPTADEPILVSARILQSLRPVASVALRYRAMFAPESEIPMRDDGSNGDARAGDGVWSAMIPAGSAKPGEMVRWMVVATDDAGVAMRSPAYSDPQRSPRYYGTVIADPSLAASRLPVLQWFIANPAAADTDSGTTTSLFFEGEFHDNVRANIHGQSTREFPKKSYDIDFHPGHNFRWRADQPRVDDINLLTTWADKSHLRNVLAYETYEQAGVPAHFAFAVRVQLNGKFHAVANIVENGDDNFLERLGLDPQGALYKMYNGAESTSGAEKKTRKNEGVQDLSALISGIRQRTGQAREAFLFDNLDVPEIINFLAARAITADTDCCHKNYYLYRDTNGSGEWQAFPWDVDLSFGRVWTCGNPCRAYYDETIYTDVGLFTGDNNVVFGAVLNSSVMRQMYFRRIRTLMDQLTQPPDVPPAEDRWLRRTSELRDRIAPDAALDLAKWGTWGRRETITQAVDRIHREFLPARRQFLFVDRVEARVIPQAQPANALISIAAVEPGSPAGSPLQEYLTITNSNAYAVDISDWSLDGSVRFRFKPGTVLPARSSAFVTPSRRAFRERTQSPRAGERRLVLGDYEGELSSRGGSIVLRDATGRVVNDHRFAGEPSPAQDALRITELMFHPPGDPDAPLEFIELRNIGSVPLELAGIRFTRGISFDFTTSAIPVLQPGEHVVLVEDLTAFRGQYGDAPPVAGVYTGSLSNAGERIRLEDAQGEPILDFTYPANKYASADGLGFSLVFSGPLTSWQAWNDARHWRPGAQPGGSPGRDETPLPTTPVVINEVLTRSRSPQTDAVELHNPTDQPANVGNWWLSDDRRSPFKFRIPPGTTIPPRGYLVFDESHFNNPPSAETSFAFSSDGDEVWLYAADADGQLTGYSDGFEFGPAASGVSFGRHTNSAGEVLFPPQREVTLGRANAGPLVGPVIISEIQFAPPRGGIPFIEIANTSDSAISLFDPQAPERTWRLAGVDYQFPAGFVLAPGGRVLIVGGDPFDFRVRYATPDDVPVLGPWNGTLQPEGERIALEAPAGTADPAAPGMVVDEVEYSSRAPWPGTGSSLARISPHAFGNDPRNWSLSSTLSEYSAWKQSHFSGAELADRSISGDDADPDGDRQSNLREFLSGTDPRDPSSVLRLEVELGDDGSLRLVVPVVQGRSYLIQRRLSVPEGAWEPLQVITSQPANALIQVDDPEPVTPLDSRFYRVITPVP